MTESPSTSPQSAKPLFEVRIRLARLADQAYGHIAELRKHAAADTGKKNAA